MGLFYSEPATLVVLWVSWACLACFLRVRLWQVLFVQRSACVRPPALLRQLEDARAAAAGAGESRGLPGTVPSTRDKSTMMGYYNTSTQFLIFERRESMG